jgi:DNA-binding NtrC family response regulator
MANHVNHILIVTRDPIMRNLFRDVLVKERQVDTVKAAGTFEEALTASARRVIDVLIVEEAMSGMDSLIFIDRVQACHPEMHVVLITTADRDEMEERRPRHSMPFTLFTKPFSIDALLKHVDWVLVQKTRLEAPSEQGIKTCLVFGGQDRVRDYTRRRFMSTLQPILGLS